MAAKDDAVLAGLCAQFEQKYSQGQKLLDNPAATGPDLSKAEALFKECEALQVKIDDRNELGTKAAALRSEGDALDRWSREPVRRIPFSGQPAEKGFQFGERGGRIDAGKTQAEKQEDSGGFKSLGHFAHALYKCGRNGNSGDPSAIASVKSWESAQGELRKKELQFKTPSGMYEESDPDGGILIPREYSNQVYERMVATNQILQYLSPIPISGNTMTIPALLEDSRVDGKRGGGALGYWPAEAAQYTSSKSRLRDITLKLHKLTVMTFVTEELMNDSAGAIQSFLLARAPKEINFKINDAVINGKGEGIPQGILNANSKITAAAVSGQGANTIVWTNIPKMYKRLVASQRGTMVWLYNQAAEDQLALLYMPTGTAAGIAIFRPNENGDGGFKFYNRPALVMEQCQDLGTEGDLIGFCPEGYACITKGGIESFMSMHLRFDYDEICYKWRFRFDGQPYDDVALTPYNGSTTVSSIVTLNSSRT
ncbi:MAG TPA: phage major capsid protein [Planctomycetaceae bacterium]|nr:phage major capsid protein [Planctomycetaceae bacterium]